MSLRYSLLLLRGFTNSNCCCYNNNNINNNNYYNCCSSQSTPRQPFRLWIVVGALLLSWNIYTVTGYSHSNDSKFVSFGKFTFLPQRGIRNGGTTSSSSSTSNPSDTPGTDPNHIPSTALRPSLHKFDENEDRYDETETDSFYDVEDDYDVDDEKSKYPNLPPPNQRWSQSGTVAIPELQQQTQTLHRESTKKSEETLTFTPNENSTHGTNTNIRDELTLVESLTKPFIAHEVWHGLSGTEFQEHADELLEPLAIMGEHLALHDEPNEWIDWRSSMKNSPTSEEGGIHVWTGKVSRPGMYYGSDLPIIKTRSIIPLAVEEMVDLLMDSTRIQTYNPWSVGRRDCWVCNNHTKIVKNRVQPPIGSKAMVSTTLLHARPAKNAGQGAWIVVSRAVGGNCFADDEDETLGRTDILLGVNLLQPLDDASCRMTALTHAYSSTIPNILAERLGVKGAIKFVKDIRELKVAVQ